jgi:predicted nuclease of restriction endonuclease-like RecB superfamily
VAWNRKSSLAPFDMCTRQCPLFDVGKLRAVITEEAQKARDIGPFDRSEVIAASAQRLGLSVAAIDAQLFSDLPGERCIHLPKAIPDTCSLAIRTNLALAQGLLGLASRSRLISMG